MKLLVGLGNPGDQYRETRHNLGFIFLDKFREENSFSDWKYESKFTADISSGIIEGEKTLLVKPQTFMNLSGESLQKLCQFYKLTPSDDISVIYDDISMDFGKIRVRDTGSAGGHNGVKSIVQHLGDSWKRIKVGVGNNPKYEVSDWVLSKFTADELIDIDNEIYEKTQGIILEKKTPKKNTNLISKKIKQVYCIGIGGIGVSALARYYLSQGWKVSGSDAADSQIIHSLKQEGCNISIGNNSDRIHANIDLVIHTEAIPESQEELKKSRELGLTVKKYNDALASVVNTHKLIAITGTHGKSTTTSMISQILHNSDEDFKSIIGTLLKEFDGKNYFGRGDKNYFAIEACEYKEHFLAYKPTVAVITNIEYDHADYFKTPESYIKAYEKFIENIVPGGFCIINSDDINSKSLIGLRDDITYIDMQELEFPEIIIHIPGEHILFDAKLAYIVGHMIGIDDKTILETLEDYSGVWRRMEKIGNTQNGNLLMSDYGHHPTEVETTLNALKTGFPEKKLFVIFQPHQYSRTIELFDGFKSCFSHADTVIVPDIYESRDSDEDKSKMSSEIFVNALHHTNKHNGKGLDNTLKLIETYDKENPNSSILLLLGAGSIDNLRYKIKTS